MILHYITMEENKKIEYTQKPRIAVPHELKGLLDNLKLTENERYEDVIKRLVNQVMDTMNQINKEQKKDE